MRKIILPVFLMCLASFKVTGQDSSKVQVSHNFFVDAYYAYDFTTTAVQPRQPYLYNHNTNNSLSLNLALAQFSVESENFRSNIGLMMGDYVQYNLAHEPNGLKNIFEGYGGFKVGKVWVDAGVFGSNLGFESAISTDNLTLTRSLVAENSPYYLSGVRFTYQPNDKWTFLGVVSNGWQLIRDNNKYKAFGTQVTFTPNDKLTINSSTFIGDESISGNQNMYFHDFYLTKGIGDKINLIVGFDYGMVKNSVLDTYDYWLGSVIIGQYIVNEKLRVALRGELFNDDRGYALGLGAQILGASCNVDYQINEYATFRTEYRLFNTSSSFLPDNNSFLVSSLAFNF